MLCRMTPQVLHRGTGIYLSPLTSYGRLIADASPNPRWQALDPESDDSQDTAGNEWVAVNRINAVTGQNFKSWAEYFGPIVDRNDQFSHKVSHMS